MTEGYDTVKKNSLTIGLGYLEDYKSHTSFVILNHLSAVIYWVKNTSISVEHK